MSKLYIINTNIIYELNYLNTEASCVMFQVNAFTFMYVHFVLFNHFTPGHKYNCDHSDIISLGIVILQRFLEIDEDDDMVRNL